MRTCSSLERIRWRISDSPGEPGEIAFLPESAADVAASKESSLRPDSTVSSSGPWQAKHRFERMGRIWVLKSIFESLFV